jgi:hypothetical protein
MKGLNARDMLILTKGFLNALNDVANGDEHRCVESSQIFEFTGLKAFGSVVVPNVIQELVRQGRLELQERGKIGLTGPLRAMLN